ncbi:MAG TPA: hypothetical protein VK400_00825 [Pyrinomonadaceae bacterium]|nr:hypothetical protein [Pyrinomonadaceae bacterium]
MKIIFQICLLFGFSLTATEIAYSCVCVPVGHQAEIEKTDAIFSGRVIEIMQDTSYVPAEIAGVSPGSQQRKINTEKRYLVKFEIETGFKGIDDGGEITLVQYEYGKPLSCGSFLFTKGNKYLVYASRQKNELSGAGMCSRTRSFNKKSKDYRELLQLRLKAKNKRVS